MIKMYCFVELLMLSNQVTIGIYFYLIIWRNVPLIASVSELFMYECDMLLMLQILVETGHMGRQASAAVTVTDGETVSFIPIINASHSFNRISF